MLIAKFLRERELTRVNNLKVVDAHRTNVDPEGVLRVVQRVDSFRRLGLKGV